MSRNRISFYPKGTAGIRNRRMRNAWIRIMQHGDQATNCEKWTWLVKQWKRRAFARLQKEHVARSREAFFRKVLYGK